jgi:hypothetical protein
MLLTNNFVFIFDQDLGYNLVGSTLVGESLNIKIKNIPVSDSTSPRTYYWEMRPEPAFANGYQNWSGATPVIQSNTGSLISVNSTELFLTIPFPTNVANLQPGKNFSFSFALDVGSSPNTGVQVVLSIAGVSPNPTSTGLLPPTYVVTSFNSRAGAVVLNSQDVSTALGYTPADSTVTAPVQSVAGKTGIVTLAKGDVGLSNVANVDTTNPANITQSALYRFVTDTEKTTWNGKQDALVSGTNLKTVNGTTLLGPGNVIISGGSSTWGGITGTLSNQTDLQTALNQKGTKKYTYTIGSSSDCDYIYNGTDIAVAINAAVTAAPTTGATIFLKAGIYNQTTTINFKNKSNLQLIGAGMEHTTINRASLTTAAFDCYNDTLAAGSNYRFKFKIESLTIDNTSAATGSIAFKFGMLSDSAFRDINVRNFETAYSLNDGMFYNNFYNCKAENCKNDVVTTAGPTDKPNSNGFIGCKFLADSDLINTTLGSHRPVTINDGNQNVFINCQFENFTRAIYVNDIGNTFIANRVESNDVTATVVHVQTTSNGKNNQFTSNYYSGNDFTDFTTNILNAGEGNAFYEGNTFKGQSISFERNLITAGPVATFKRTGSGNGEGIIIAEDTYTPSGSPINFLAKAVRAAAKLYQGTLNGVENFYVTAQGQGYFANGILAGSQRIQNVATPTSSTDASNKDYVDNPYSWTPSNYGYISWNFDPSSISNQTVITAGTLNVVKLRMPRAATISNIILNIGSAGVGLANAYAALYQNGTLLTQSTDQSANWTSTGNKVMAITPQAVVAGTIDIAIWVGSATTAPGIARGGSQAGANGGLTGTNLRWSTADTGITTTAPTTLGSRTTSNNTFWAAVS